MWGSVWYVHPAWLCRVTLDRSSRSLKGELPEVYIPSSQDYSYFFSSKIYFTAGQNGNGYGRRRFGYEIHPLPNITHILDDGTFANGDDVIRIVENGCKSELSEGGSYPVCYGVWPQYRLQFL